MGRVAVIVLLLVGLPVAFIGWYSWDSGRDRGFQFGYYGEYNGVSNALASIPGVVITKHWHNLDVSLEEFGFDFSFEGAPVRLNFGETDAVRSMSHKEVVAALRRRIARELSPSTNR